MSASLGAIIMVNITKEQFESYETVRQSGITNMFNVTKVEQLSGLKRPTIIQIMENYGDLQTKYNK